MNTSNNVVEVISNEEHESLMKLTSWLIRQIWEAETISEIGDYLMCDDKLKDTVSTLKRIGLSEENMSCLNGLPIEQIKESLKQINSIEDRNEQEIY